MSAENDKDLIRSKRYTRLAIFSAFLLAFFWPLGSFFFWIFSATTGYLVFLAYYYSPRSKQFASNPKKSKQSRTESSEVYEHGQWDKPLDTDQKQKVRLAIFTFSGIVIFIAVVVGFLSSSDSEKLTSENTNSSEETTDRVALQNDPNDINALTNIGNQFYSIQQYDSAIFYYERVLTIDPRNTACLHNKALVLYQKKDYVQSLQWSKKCLSVDPEYIDAILLIGDGYYAQEKFNEAIVWYQQAYAKGAHHTELLSVMAYIYDKQNNQGEAIRFYKETIGQDSSYAEAYARLAELDPGRKEWYRKKVEQLKLR